ncbi:MAG: cytochrome-c oxidase, cbb3-type subunit II, partial [Phycisphaerales bacterium JB061]
DAFMQWWYGHNAVAFFLTTPFLGLMYYFLPKAANRPVFSYKLSIIHFWSLVFIYIWAGPHHLHYTALPQWASTLGMVFSLMLWMPSWGGMINGLLTLRGAWHKVATDPVLKFFVVGVTFYGMSTFEGPLLSVKTVNALSHYTDWTIAHVHSGTLGWNSFMTFGMLYWLAPRIFQTGKIHSEKLVSLHFWVGTVGILLYVISIYTAGITQGLMWRAFDESGQLMYPEFIETVTRLMPFYWIRAIGGTLFLLSACLGGYNLVMTWMARPKKYEVPVHEAPALSKEYDDGPAPQSRLTANAGIGHAGDKFLQGHWHRRWERLPVRFTVWVVVAVGVASLFEIIPTFLIKSNIPTISTVLPYTPLEVAGRDIYIAEGCYNCHSQMVRPIYAETQRYGEYSKPGEFVYDRPFQWGSRRIGPDLAREGVNNPNTSWHYQHFEDPQVFTSGSIMPSYKHLIEGDLDYGQIQSRIRALAMIGTPYGEAVKNAEAMAREQAQVIADDIRAQMPGVELPEDLENKKVIALIAYVTRLGTDIYRTPEPAADEAAPAAEEGGAQ